MLKPKTRNEGTMTEAAFFGTIRSALRELSFKGRLYQPRKAALDRQRVQRGQYHCQGCGLVVGSREIEVDHVVPAGSLSCWEDLGPFAQRLFCGSDGLQVLCRECHRRKHAD